MNRKAFFLSMAVLAIFFAQGVHATMAPILPRSSHYQGFTFYNEQIEDPFGNTEQLQGRIDFAVYDTFDLQNPEETAFAGNFEMPEGDQFIYVYQIVNDLDGSEEAVGFLEVLNLAATYITADLMNETDALDDDNEGVAPEENDGYSGRWGWNVADTVDSEEHSWFLVFTSANDWVPGTYDISPVQESDLPIPEEIIPEPASVGLLLFGGAMLLRRRKQQINRTKRP